MKRLIPLLLLALVVTGLVNQARAQDTLPQDRAEVLARLAAIQLQSEIDRDFDGAERALSTLESQLAGTPLEAVLGEGDAAALRRGIRALIDEARGDDEPALQETVADAIIQDDEITLSTLGPRAAALLRQSLESETGPLAVIDLDDRLTWLLRLDEPAGWEMLKTDPLRFGPESPGDVLEAVLRSGMTTTQLAGRPPQLDRPEWLDWIARLLEAPATAERIANYEDYGELLELLRKLVWLDGFTPRITSALAKLLRPIDGRTLVAEVFEVFDGTPWTPSAQALLEAFVADERLAVREAVARNLLRAELSPALRARVDDPAAGMRLLVVQALSPRQRSVASWGGRGESSRTVGEGLPQAQDDDARDLLARLAGDSDPAVREAVVDVLDGLVQPLAPDVYRRLGADPDAQVREAVVSLEHPDTVLMVEIRTALARDPEPRVVAAIDQYLARGDWRSEPEALAEVFRARLQNQAVPLSANHLAERLASAGAFQVLIRAVLDRDDQQALLALAQSRANLDQLRNEMLRLPGSDFARLLTALHSVKIAGAELVESRLAYVPGWRDPGASDALEPVVSDPKRPLSLRLVAATYVMCAPTPERLDLLRSLLAEPALAEGTPDDPGQEGLVQLILQALPESVRNAAIQDILAHVPLRRRLMSRVLNAFVRDAPGAGPLAREIVDRFVEDDLNHSAVEWALSALGRNPELMDEELMRRALHARYEHFISTVRAMGRTKDPRFLELLRESLDPTWIPAADADYTRIVVEAIHGYMSDEAAAILLEAASASPRASVREQALAAVEAIGRYRDALAGWQRRTGGAESRDAAVARLLALVADHEATVTMRAEALRGLGTLQAVEQIPLLIAQLENGEPAIREAAQAALDRLNAPPERAQPAGGAPGN